MLNEEQIVNFVSSVFYQGEDIIVGPGDDCAVIKYTDTKYILFTIDQLISDVHYISRATSPDLIAGKLLNRNISDIAAMGGSPRRALLSLCGNYRMPPYGNDEWLKNFFRSLAEQARKHSISICGGDISSVPYYDRPYLALSLALIGEVESEKLCLRSNVKDGDLIFVTGELGNSFESGHHLTFKPRLDEARFLSGNYTNAMIDVSDGVIKDAFRMATASNIAIFIDTEKLPRRNKATIEKALSDGEDYELLFAIPQSKSDLLLNSWQFPETPLTCIGVASKKNKQIGVFDSVSGDDLRKKYLQGYDHFNPTNI